MKLDEIYKQLSDYASQQEKLICRFPCDAEYNVPSWDNIYDALDSLDSIINYEPSDAELEAYNNSYSDIERIRKIVRIYILAFLQNNNLKYLFLSKLQKQEDYYNA